eukprot:g5200.t1
MVPAIRPSRAMVRAMRRKRWLDQMGESGRSNRDFFARKVRESRAGDEGSRQKGESRRRRGKRAGPADARAGVAQGASRAGRGKTYTRSMFSPAIPDNMKLSNIDSEDMIKYRDVEWSNLMPQRGAQAASLSPLVERNIRSGLEYEHPSPFQVLVMNTMCKGNDILSIGPTEALSGRRVAHILPTFSCLLSEKRRPRKFSRKKWKGGIAATPYALIIEPSADDVAITTEEARSLLANTPFRVASVGSSNMRNFSELEMLAHGGADLIIGTPGRLMQHFFSGCVSFSRVHCLSLDLLDRMSRANDLRKVRRIVQRSDMRPPSRRQTHVLVGSPSLTAAMEDVAGACLRQSRCASSSLFFGEYKVDLSPMEGIVMKSMGSPTGGDHQFSFCANNAGGTPMCTGMKAMAVLCQTFSRSGFVIATDVGIERSNYTAMMPGTSTDEKPLGVTLVVQNAPKPSPTSPPPPRLTVMFVCSESAPRSPRNFTVALSTKTSFTYRVMTSSACPTFVPGGESGESKWGTTFLIYFCLVLVLYIAGGCYWNRRKHGLAGTQA